MPIRNVFVNSGGWRNPSLNLSYVPDLADVDQNVLATRRAGQQVEMGQNQLNAYGADRAHALKKQGWEEGAQNQLVKERIQKDEDRGLRLSDNQTRRTRETEDRAQAKADAARRRKWDKEDRKTAKESMAISHALKAKDPKAAQNIYKKFNPEDKTPPSFSWVGDNITIDGGPGEVKIEGPSAAVEIIVKELEKYPEIQKNPEHLRMLMEEAARLGVSITQNPAAKTGWTPQSKTEAIEFARAKKSAGSDKTQARIDRLRKDVPLMAEKRARLLKGDKLDTIMSMIDPELMGEMKISGKETIDEAVTKFDEYSIWVRKELGRLEKKRSTGADDNDPARLF